MTDLPTLEYRPAPRRRVTWRLAGLILLVVGALIATQQGYQRWYVPWLATQQVKLAAQQRLKWETDCLHWRDAPNAVIWAKGENVSPLSTLDRFAMPRENGYHVIPSAWKSFVMNSAELYQAGIAFLHAREAQTGESRLVVIDVRGDDELWFYARVLGPRSTAVPTRIPLLRRFTSDSETKIHVYAGQPDPNDASAFTIRCGFVHKRREGEVENFEILHGRLLPDGSVSLTPDVGFMSQTMWELLAPNGRPLTPWDSPERKRFGGGPRTK